MDAFVPRLRRALVIGIAKYGAGSSAEDAIPSLRNPINDALLIQSSLKKLSFDVDIVVDPGPDELHACIQAFAARALPSQLSFIFISSHGINCSYPGPENTFISDNHIVPSLDRLPFDNAEELERSLLSIGKIKSLFTDTSSALFLFLDCCRTVEPPPFYSAVVERASATAPSGAAVAAHILEPQKPKEDVRTISLPSKQARLKLSNIFIGYSTAHGAYALDGDELSSSSRFAKALAAHLIDDGGLEISALFAKIRDYVVEQTKGAQVPWSETTLSSRIFSVAPLSLSVQVPKISEEELSAKETLDEGASSKVMKASWKGEHVAVKYIGSAHKAKLQQEIGILWNVRHKNVVQLIGASQSEPFFLVMELLNTSLNKWIDMNDGPPDDVTACQIAKDVASALAYLHALSPPLGPVIHGDIKSENILLDDSNRAKVTDFGLSRKRTNWSRSISSISEAAAAAAAGPDLSAAGSIPYMAPELFKGHTNSEFSDVYAFGMVLFELISGQRPWNQPLYHINPSSIMKQVVEGKRPYVDAEFPDMPYGQDAEQECEGRPLRSTLIDISIRCWNDEKRARPSFSIIHKELTEALAAHAPAASASATKLASSSSISPSAESDAKSPGAAGASVFSPDAEPEPEPEAPLTPLSFEDVAAAVAALADDTEVQTIVAEALLTNNEALDLSGTCLADSNNVADTLANMSCLQYFTELILDNSSLGSESLNALLQSPFIRNINKLQMQGNELEDRVCAYISRSPHLKKMTHLDLSFNELTYKGAAVLSFTVPSFSPNLKILKLKANRIDDNGAFAIATTPALKKLSEVDLFDNKLTICGANNLVRGRMAIEGPTDWQFPWEAKDLLLEGEASEIKETVNAHLSPSICQRIDASVTSKSLDLHDESIDNSMLFYITQHPKLQFAGVESFDLSGNSGVGYSGLHNLFVHAPLMRSIKRLNVSDTRAESWGLFSLANSPHVIQLEELNIQDSGIGNEGCKFLSIGPCLSTLKRLDISGSGLTDAGLQFLAASKTLVNLESLNISGNTFTKNAGALIGQFQVFSKLKELKISFGDSFGDEGFKSLCASPFLGSLEVLECNGNFISANGVRALTTSKSINQLKKLSLNLNEIGDAGAKYIANAKNLALVVEMDLSRCKVGQEGLMAIAESKTLVCLSYLKMHGFKGAETMDMTAVLCSQVFERCALDVGEKEAPAASSSSYSAPNEDGSSIPTRDWNAYRELDSMWMESEGETLMSYAKRTANFAPGSFGEQMFKQMFDTNNHFYKKS